MLMKPNSLLNVEQGHGVHVSDMSKGEGLLSNM